MRIPSIIITIITSSIVISSIMMTVAQVKLSLFHIREFQNRGMWMVATRPPAKTCRVCFARNKIQGAEVAGAWT